MYIGPKATVVSKSQCARQSEEANNVGVCAHKSVIEQV